MNRTIKLEIDRVCMLYKLRKAECVTVVDRAFCCIHRLLELFQHKSSPFRDILVIEVAEVLKAWLSICCMLHTH